MPSKTRLDSIIQGIDLAIRAVFPPDNRPCKRERPDKGLEDVNLTSEQKQNTGALMRVNHTGEVCAQALYQGQAVTASQRHTKNHMQKAAEEEVDHLAWCEARLQELGARPSYLNPVWYLGSWLIGATAGLIGDKVSLGFLAETERQVSRHLQRHLDKIPREDQKTKKILETMQADELQHAEMAQSAGAITLPPIIRQFMKIASKLMTTSSYYM